LITSHFIENSYMKTELKQSLTLVGLTMIAIGASIGSGIFRTPGKIVAALHQPELVIMIWVVGGIIALCGALTFGELGGLFPKAGGIYIYLKEAYGDQVGFLYGWTNLLIMNTGSMAGLAFTFSSYLNNLIPINETIFSIAIIIIVTIINIFGVKNSEIFSSIFTTLKIIGIIAIVIVGAFFASNYTLADGTIVRGALKLAEPSPPDNLWKGIAIAMVGVLWSYGGWQHTSYLSGEAKNPKRDIPLAMLIGAAVVTICYVSVNLAYLNLLPTEQMASTKAVASDAISTISITGSKWISILIMCSTFGTLGIYAMSLPRVYFAMANDGLFFKQLTYVHPKYKTPAFAILLQSVWAIVLVMFLDFEKILNYVEFMDWVFLCLAGSTIFVFRSRLKNADRPVKTFLYPITPIIFCGVSLWFLYMTLTGEHSSMQALAGLGILGLGIPVYFIFKKMKNK
jgi:basic amino acid/polyamine antiporter, APA family